MDIVFESKKRRHVEVEVGTFEVHSSSISIIGSRVTRVTLDRIQ